MKRRWAVAAAAVAMMLLGREAMGIIYLGENSLESLLVRCPVVVIVTVVSVDAEGNHGVVRVEKAIKGEVKGDVTVKGVMRRVSGKEKKPRFDAGEKTAIFAGQDAATGTLTIIAVNKLANDREAKLMEGCIAEVAPFAAMLNDLANVRKEIDQAALRAAIVKLAASENEYTKILTGRLMATRLAERVKPEGWEEVIVAGLKSKRPELKKGALTWAAKFTTLPAEVRAAVEEVAREKGDEGVAAAAKKVLSK